MTRCPQCGQNMYPEDEEEPAPVEESSLTTWPGDLYSLFIGVAISNGIIFIILYIARIIFAVSRWELLSISILLISGLIGALVGGYVAAHLSAWPRKWIGTLVGLLDLPFLVLFATIWFSVDLSFIQNPWVIMSGVLTVLAGMLGGWLNYLFVQETSWKEKWRVRGWEDLLYQDLLRKVRFNGSIADRLIEYERQQDPQANRLKLIQNAIERWDRDNR